MVILLGNMNTNHLQTSLTNLAPVEGELYLIEKFYSPQHADKLFNCFRSYALTKEL